LPFGFFSFDFFVSKVLVVEEEEESLVAPVDDDEEAVVEGMPMVCVQQHKQSNRSSKSSFATCFRRNMLLTILALHV